MNCYNIIDALVFPHDTCRDQALHINQPLAQFFSNLILWLLSDLERLIDVCLLLSRETLTREVEQELAQVVQANLVVHSYYLTGEEVPFLSAHLLGNGLEKVQWWVFHDFLVQWAVAWLLVEKCVLPATLVLAWLTLALGDVLTEVKVALWRNILADGLSEILVWYLAILVIVEPVK